MFSHRGLFLAVTISLASIALASVIVQPGYKYQYDSNPRHLQDQSAPQYSTQSPIEQSRGDQLPYQESTRYLPGVQTTEKNEDPKEMVHNRRKISDPASTESSESKIVEHDNDVAAKSPLTDVKRLTTIDSLLSQNEPTDTIDKRLENCQTVKNLILPILAFVDSTISRTNITLSFPEHEPTDTNDKRLKKCLIENSLMLVFILMNHSNSTGLDRLDTLVVRDGRLS